LSFCSARVTVSFKAARRRDSQQQTENKMIYTCNRLTFATASSDSFRAAKAAMKSASIVLLDVIARVLTVKCGCGG
jgi:hypothetical protein